MPYSRLADLVLLVHFAFILFVVLGGLLVMRRPWLAWLHLPAAVWGALIEFAGWTCPLTPLEVSLRRAGGEAGYAGGFIERYLSPTIYPEGLTRSVQVALGLVVVAINVLVYLRVARRKEAPGGTAALQSSRASPGSTSSSHIVSADDTTRSGSL